MKHHKPSADILAIPAKELGKRYAIHGMNYNPYLSGTKGHREFQLGYDAHLARTQPHGNDSTTRKQ